LSLAGGAAKKAFPSKSRPKVGHAAAGRAGFSKAILPQVPIDLSIKNQAQLQSESFNLARGISGHAGQFRTECPLSAQAQESFNRTISQNNCPDFLFKSSVLPIQNINRAEI
jgi:hypothetical protein